MSDAPSGRYEDHEVGSPQRPHVQTFQQQISFDGSPLPACISDRGELLKAFVGSGIRKLLSARTLVHPAVVVHGADSLSGVLQGFEKGVLTAALEAVPVRSVTFVFR